MVSGSSLCYLSDFLYLYEGLFIESLLIIAIVLKTISCILYFTVSHRKYLYPVVALGTTFGAGTSPGTNTITKFKR